MDLSSFITLMCTLIISYFQNLILEPSTYKVRELDKILTFSLHLPGKLVLSTRQVLRHIKGKVLFYNVLYKLC